MVKGKVEEAVSGVGVEEKKLIWRIENFSVVKRRDGLIKAQMFEFQAGESIDLSSKWRIFLSCDREEFPGYIGIYLGLIEKPETKQDCLFAEVGFKIKDETGALEAKIPTEDWFALNLARGFATFIWKNEAIPLEYGSLVILCEFRLYANSPSLKKISAVDEMLEKFHVSSKAKAGRDLAHLLGIEICSREGKQFRARKEELAARSPVFEAMFREDGAEEKLKLELTDVSSQTMEVFLHYLGTGELLPNWRQREVILELTSVAAKYEIQDLLGFLDTVLQKMGEGANAVPVGEPDPKNAEKGLKDFVDRKGLPTKKNSSCAIV